MKRHDSTMLSRWHICWGIKIVEVAKQKRRMGKKCFAKDIRKDKMNGFVREVALEEGYVLSKFRESRDSSGALTFLRGAERQKIIRGLPVFNVATGLIEDF